MITIRKSKDRGYFDHGWLKTHHTFSFSDYFDPKFMGFGPLRVINEDIIQGGEGFPTHPHKDMEIITYIVEGALAHKDSTGSKGMIKPGEVQKMSAGRGIRHSEFNHLQDKPTHLYQIWILPDKEGIQPEYHQKDFSEKLNSGQPTLLVSRDGLEDSITVHQHLSLWGRRFLTDEAWPLTLLPTELIWVQQVKGTASIEASNSRSYTLGAGDAVAISDEESFEIRGTPHSEVLVFISQK